MSCERLKARRRTFYAHPKDAINVCSRSFRSRAFMRCERLKARLRTSHANPNATKIKSISLIPTKGTIKPPNP